ncbi:MAG TPA: hypothetical protein VGM29_00095 [Polyangiaceae bacterium]
MAWSKAPYLRAALLATGFACGCGNVPGINYYDSPTFSAGGALAAGGAGSGGVSGSGVSGSGVSGSATGGTGTAGMPNDGRCAPAMEVSGQSYTLNTTGPVCLRVQQDLQGWGCSNADDRTIKINGMTMTCGTLPLPPKVSGSYYFDISAGMLAYAQIYWF